VVALAGQQITSDAQAMEAEAICEEDAQKAREDLWNMLDCERRCATALARRRLQMRSYFGDDCRH
jgi:hypothetical protein